jgi:hypothetical protein
MSANPKHILTRQNSPSWLVQSASLLIPIGVGVGLSSGYAVEELAVLSRFIVFVYAAVLAFITPWVLFPLQRIYVYQALNPSRADLLRIFSLRMSTLLGPAIILMIAILVGSGDYTWRFRLLAESVVTMTGLSIFASWRYLRMGRVSQLWQEGLRGATFMAAMREAGSTYGMPAGSYPTIGATMSIALSGMLAVVLGAWLSGVSGMPMDAAGGILLMVGGLAGWFRSWPKLDTEFFHTHGFYEELFRNPGGKSDGGRDPIPHASLYWIPGNLRTQVWMLLRQMDRKIPAGRLLLSAYLVIWVIIFSGWNTSRFVIPAVLLLVLVKNLLIWRMDSPIFAPIRFQQRFGNSFSWLMTRIFVNFRWTIPLILLHVITLYFVDAVTSPVVQIWIITDLALLLLIPLALTLRAKLRQHYEFN